MQRTLLLSLLFAVAVTVAGCASNSQPTLPTTMAPGASPALEAEPVLISGQESLAGLFEVRINPTTLEASATPLRASASQPPQAIAYDLDIEQFLTGNTFRITRLRILDDGDLSLEFLHAHPFPTPDLAAPITGMNRADLGYTGRLLILADSPLKSFFSSTVQVDPGFLRDPDGYLQPGDLLARGGLLNNTFPYRLLVDEALDNRIGSSSSNGGDPMGSYDPAQGGWQRHNIGADGLGWTGFDFMHAGQISEGSLRIAGDRLDDLTVFTVALLVKYTDPRGVGTKLYRFPGETVDVTQFAYRLPHAALDASKIVMTQPVQFGDFAGSARTLRVLVRDWDALAPEGADLDLSDELDPTLVLPGTTGRPAVEVDMPDVAPAPFPAGPATGSGLPGNEINYPMDVSNLLNPGVGSYWACVRVSDPENALDRGAYHYGVDPSTIQPTRAPVPLITYQLLPYRVGDPIPQVLDVTPSGALGLPGAAVEFAATLSGPATAVAWFLGEGASPSTPSGQLASVILNRAGTHFGTVRASGPAGTSEPFSFEYSVQTPVFPGWSTFSLGASEAASPLILLKEGRPTLFEGNLPSGTPIVMWRSSTSVPTSASEWASHSLPMNWYDDSSFGPVIAATDHLDHYVVVNSRNQIAISVPANPTSTIDWSSYAYDSVLDGGYGPTLLSLPDRLMIAAYHRGQGSGDQQDARISWSMVELPGPGMWINTVPIDFVGPPPSIVAPHGLAPSGPGVAWAFVWDYEIGAEIRLMFSNNTTPLDFSDWTYGPILEIEPSIHTPSIELLRDQDRLQILYSTGRAIRMGRARTAEPLLSTDWQFHTVFSEYLLTMRDLNLRFAGNRPIVLYTTWSSSILTTPMQLHLLRPLSGVYDHEDDWERRLFRSTVGATPYGERPVASLQVLEGRLHVAYIDREAGNTLQYAVSDGLW